MEHASTLCPHRHPGCQERGLHDPGMPDDIRRHGYGVLTVMPNASRPPFSYTLGLFKTFDHLDRDPEDGTWEFLCGTTQDPDELYWAPLSEIQWRDRTVRDVADLPTGFEARRRKPGSRWRVRPAHPVLTTER